MATIRYEVLGGTMKFKLGRKTIIARAGDVVEVPSGKKSRVESAGVTPAVARVDVSPG
jgi:quercetin dioxygenase-like cupin family protein